MDLFLRNRHVHSPHRILHHFRVFIPKGLLIELLRLEVEKLCLNSLQADRPWVSGVVGGGLEKLVPREETHLFEVYSLLPLPLHCPELFPASPPRRPWAKGACVQAPRPSTVLIGGPAQTCPWGPSGRKGQKPLYPLYLSRSSTQPAGSLLTPSSNGLSSMGTSDCFPCPLSPSLGATTTLSLPQLC